MPILDLGLVKGDKGDPFTYEDFTAEQLASLKGETGSTPIIKAGSATALESTAAPTVSAVTSGITTTFNFGIPKGDTSAVETPAFDDTTSTYTSLSDANTAAETTSTAIASGTSLFTILSNMKKSFSAIIQGLKFLGTNVGAITGITSDLAGESETVAASIKALNQVSTSLSEILITKTVSNINLTVPANGSNNVEVQFPTVEGYKPLLSAFCGGGNNKLSCRIPVRTVSNATLTSTFYFDNFSAIEAGATNFMFICLYIKVI